MVTFENGCRFGMTTFYFMMGIYVHIDGKFFEKNFGWSILFTLIVVFVAPVVIWIFGWLAGLQSRTTIYTSLLSNSLVPILLLQITLNNE